MLQQSLFSKRSDGVAVAPISPMREMGAYEELWAQSAMTFKRMADLFRENPDSLPSDLVPGTDADRRAALVMDMLSRAGVTRFGVRIHRAGEYPGRLRDAAHPVELLYYFGFWPLVETRCVAVVGTRHPTEEGLRTARLVSQHLSSRGFTIVSGLAAGIDTAAHTSALDHDGRTIAVIGTPLSSVYPEENRALQARIGREHLVISQVPVYRYSVQDHRQNRFFFPERNATMSALSEATIIIEAGETSGTLTQARAALRQGRKLLIMDGCFQRAGLTWPKKFEGEGAIRIKSLGDIEQALG